MDSRLRGNDGERFARMARTHDCVVSDPSLSFPRRRESIGHHSDPHHGQQTQRNALHIGVINNLEKRVSVAGVPPGTSDQVMRRHLVALNRPVLRCKSSK